MSDVQKSGKDLLFAFLEGVFVVLPSSVSIGVNPFR